jgi:L-alanine-DL-glutamate epimerase-like enolase superfamily enzyme
MEKIVYAELGCAREPLRAPFGFKGGTLSELWQVCVRLTLDSGETGMGIGVQSVLWSGPEVFCAYDEKGGNEKMLDVTRRALDMLRGMAFTTPPEMIATLVPALLKDTQKQLGNVHVPQTFVLNALVAVDFALWQLWNAKHGDNTFGTLTNAFCPMLTKRETALGSIPLITYHTPEAELRGLLENGAFLLKIKIGSDPNRDGDPAAMLAWDTERLREIHKIACGYTTCYTDCGRPVYYLDANGRYPNRAWLLRLLDAADRMGALEHIVLLEEPFPESALAPVHDLPVRVAGDESAHSAADVERLTEEYGYSAIACKSIAKTLSVTLEMIRAAQKSGAACFCADLTVPPIMLDWNMSLAARLPHVPGLRVGVVESNGPQNYTDWKRLDAMCAIPGAPWRIPHGGVYPLDDTFYNRSGIFTAFPAYARLLRPV